MARRLALGSLALLAAVCVVAATAGADESGRARFGRGKRHLGFAAGYGMGFSLGFTGDGDTRDIGFLALLPRWQVGLSDHAWEESWYGGNLDLLFEPAVLVGFEPRGGVFAGGTALFRYNFLGARRLVPYVEGGGGMGYLDFDLRDQRDGFAFLLQAGAGAQLFVRPGMSVDLAWRFQHISNAGTSRPNNGLNASLPLLGVTLHLD